MRNRLKNIIKRRKGMKKVSSFKVKKLVKSLGLNPKFLPKHNKKNKQLNMSEKKSLEEIYFYFFDGTELNVKNIISYYNGTIHIDSFNITIEGINKTDLTKFLFENGFVNLSKHENLNNKYNKESSFPDYMYDESADVFCTENYEAILTLNNSKKKSFDIMCTFVSKFEPVAKVKKYLESFCRKFDNRIQIITKRQHGYDVEAIDVKKINIDFNLNYNDDFDHLKLIENIESEENGIIMLSGVPGSGKSSLIKYLVRQTDKQFCYLPANNIELFSDPSAIPFIIQELNNKILVIEDCEKLLKSREHTDNNEVSTILNISDGILGDYLNLKMIVTLNTTEKIDDALLRKGRLLYSYDFKALTIEKANMLGESLGIVEKFTEPKSLTDVINFKKDTNIENFKKKKNTIGFNQSK